jgi:GT2 family glycosyltransferase
MPGNQFSGAFMDSWTQLFGRLLMRGFQVILSREFVSTLPVVRHRCLQVSGSKGRRQSPFGGQYDYLLWLDSDQVFTEQNFNDCYETLWLEPDKKIVAGYYQYADMSGFAFGWLEGKDDFKHITKGHKEVITRAKEQQCLVEVDWSGMGFMLMKKGVFEEIDYPYFTHPEFLMNTDTPDVLGEDLYFGAKLKAAGIPIYIHPECRIGHEKAVIL